MKKIFFTLGIFFLTIVAVFAQSNQTTLNIRLYPIQTLEVNASQKVVNLDYVTETDYANGVQLEQPDHLNMYSTGGFVVKVSSSTDNLQSITGNKIAATDILITPQVGTANPLIGAQFTSATLTSEPQIIISNETGGINKTFGIKYQAKGNNKYVNKYVSADSYTEFTSDVIYSIETR